MNYVKTKYIEFKKIIDKWLRKDHHFLGINFHKRLRPVFDIWLGPSGSHYSKRNHHLIIEFGGGGMFGFEIVVGGEDREVLLRIGLVFFTLYVAVTNIVPDGHEKAKAIALKQGGYAYQWDYSNGGRETGIMLFFKLPILISASLWSNYNDWTDNDLISKFKHFPFCEGASVNIYPLGLFFGRRNN